VATSDLGFEAARRALEAAGRQASEIDLIIVATSTPDMVFPSSATILQNKLGIAGCPAFDLQAVCSGFVYALTVADSHDQERCREQGAGDRRGGCFRASSISRTEPPACCSGTAPAPWCWRPSETPGILASDLHADGKHVEILCVPGTVFGGKVHCNPLLRMDGQAVFKLAVGVLEDCRTRGAGQGRQDRCGHRLA
jgi:3-oxoacyl-[acyl-carrier-protein] synthase-3